MNGAIGDVGGSETISRMYSLLSLIFQEVQFKRTG